MIPTDGTIERGRPEEQVGAHCKNHNRHSIGVAYIGSLLQALLKKYPKALIVGHCDLDPHKPDCPGFSVVDAMLNVEC